MFQDPDNSVIYWTVIQLFTFRCLTKNSLWYIWCSDASGNHQSVWEKFQRWPKNWDIQRFCVSVVFIFFLVSSTPGQRSSHWIRTHKSEVWINPEHTSSNAQDKIKLFCHFMFEVKQAGGTCHLLWKKKKWKLKRATLKIWKSRRLYLLYKIRNFNWRPKDILMSDTF